MRTYVIGCNTGGQSNAGDTQHRPVENEQGLLDELRRIAGVAVSCSFELDKAPRADFSNSAA